MIFVLPAQPCSAVSIVVLGTLRPLSTPASQGHAALDGQLRDRGLKLVEGYPRSPSLQFQCLYCKNSSPIAMLVNSSVCLTPEQLIYKRIALQVSMGDIAYLE